MSSARVTYVNHDDNSSQGPPSYSGFVFEVYISFDIRFMYCVCNINIPLYTYI